MNTNDSQEGAAMQVIEITRIIHVEGVEEKVLTSVPIESIDYWSEDTRRSSCARIMLKSKAQFRCVETYSLLTAMILGKGGRKQHPPVG